MCSKGQMLVIVDNIAVDVAEWVHVHPGGKLVLESDQDLKSDNFVFHKEFLVLM